MGEFIPELEPLDQSVAKLVIRRFALVALEPLLQSCDRVHQRADIERYIGSAGARPACPS